MTSCRFDELFEAQREPDWGMRTDHYCSHCADVISLLPRAVYTNASG